MKKITDVFHLQICYHENYLRKIQFKKNTPRLETFCMDPLEMRSEQRLTGTVDWETGVVDGERFYLIATQGKSLTDREPNLCSLSEPLFWMFLLIWNWVECCCEMSSHLLEWSFWPRLVNGLLYPSNP